MTPIIRVSGLAKTFVLHLRGGATLPVLRGVDFDLFAGECLVLAGPSGAGKSTLLRSLYANYRPQSGRVLVRHGEGWVDMVTAEPRLVLEVRRRTLGYVSQFLRVIPRVPALTLVMEPLLARGIAAAPARDGAEALLARMRVPERLWSVPPATFSGGEQQRINLARCFVVSYPILLLDEPTASLDAANRRTVIELIGEAKARGAAVVGIFHDREVREAVRTRVLDLAAQGAAA
jgi:alpha-D-ribose 1-methylphosphonate 5-triphosphate synthase subunit PhnL